MSRAETPDKCDHQYRFGICVHCGDVGSETATPRPDTPKFKLNPQLKGTWRCLQCGHVGEPGKELTPNYRMAGDHWQHWHQHPVGHVRMERIATPLPPERVRNEQGQVVGHAVRGEGGEVMDKRSRFTKSLDRLKRWGETDGEHKQRLSGPHPDMTCSDYLRYNHAPCSCPLPPERVRNEQGGKPDAVERVPSCAGGQPCVGWNMGHAAGRTITLAEIRKAVLAERERLVEQVRTCNVRVRTTEHDVVIHRVDWQRLLAACGLDAAKGEKWHL